MPLTFSTANGNYLRGSYNTLFPTTASLGTVTGSSVQITGITGPPNFTYNIIRNGTTIATGQSGTIYTDSTVTQSTTYTYQIVPVTNITNGLPITVGTVTIPILLTSAISTTPTVTSGTISTPLIFSTGMSISFKLNLTSTSSLWDTLLMGAEGLRIFNYYQSASSLNVFTFQVISSTSSSGGTAGTNFFITPTLNSYPTGSYHVVIAIGTGVNPNIVIYINNIPYTFGAANGIRGIGGALIATSSDLWGGKYNWTGPYTNTNLGTSTGSTYTGTKTDLRFFDYKLTSEQVNLIYTNSA